MGEVRFHGTVRFTADAPLDLEELADCVLRVEGRVSGGLGETGDYVSHEEGVGLVEAYLVQTTRLEIDGIDLGDVCHAHSDHLAGVFDALFGRDEREVAGLAAGEAGLAAGEVDEDEEYLEPKEGLSIAGRWEGLLHLHWLEVDAKCRDSGVVKQMIEATVRNFCPGGLVTSYRSVLDLSVEEWGQLGFRRIAGSEVVYRDNTAADPYGHPLDEEE